MASRSGMASRGAAAGSHDKGVPGNAFVPTAALLMVVLLSGCGISGGEALFMSGLFHRPKVKAQYELTEGPVAVLVDDFQELCYWTGTTTMLADQVMEQLREHGAAKRLIPALSIKRLRQSDSKFDQRACTHIGRMLEAEQVLAIEVRSFYATENPVEANAAARMSVAVKVINALERKHPGKVRLWPKSRRGRIVEAELNAGAVTRAKTRHGILRALTGTLAEKIARQFYDRPMDDFEKP